MAKDKLSLQEQANIVLEKAQERGISSNFFFVTTFKRYQVQMKIMADLERSISEEGMTVQKEYVKGRKNVYTNPAISEYNKTATAANGTVSTLLNIVKSWPEEDQKQSKLQDLIDSLTDE